MSLWRFTSEAHRRSLWQVLGIYLVGSWGAFQVILALVDGIGLPSWLPAAAFALFLVGLPVVLATAFVQHGLSGRRQNPDALDPALFPGGAPESGSGVRHPLTWRRAIGAGVLAFGLLGGVALGWLALRALGIGPMASLLAAEELHENDRILIAEFEPRGVDSTLAAVVSDAFRIDFSRSTVMRTVTTAELQAVLRRMAVRGIPRIDAALAAEIAQRDGIPAYVTGEVAAAGSRYLLSARLMSASTGEELVALRESARDEDDIIDAVDRLSRAMREKTGESLRTIHRAPPLGQVTTSSLEALQLYTQAVRAQSLEGNPQRAAELMREALRHDTMFAGAYRGLSTIYTNRDEPDSAIAMLERALAFSDRLDEVERVATLSAYHLARAEYTQAIAALERVLALRPEQTGSLNNMGLALLGLKQYDRAYDYFRRTIAVDTGRFFSYANAGEALVLLGRFEEAEEAYRNAARLAPQSTWAVVSLAQVPYAAGDIDEAMTRLTRLVSDSASTQSIRGRAEWRMIGLLRIQGRLAEARRRQAAQLALQAVTPEDAAWEQMDRTVEKLYIENDVAAARQHSKQMQAAIGDLDSRDMLLSAATLCGWLGDVACARSYIARSGRSLQPWSAATERFAFAALAIAEDDNAKALRILRETRHFNCHACAELDIARVFMRMQQPDSARAALELYLATPSMDRIFSDVELAPTHEWLASYYDERGDTAKAAEYYGRFLDLWNDADPHLLQRVTAARGRLQRLQRDR